MKIKRSHIIAFLSLSAAVGTSFATYQFYVKERLKVLGEREELRQSLKDRLAVIEETFYRTDPSAIIKVWQRAAQPWEDTVATRSKFYNLGETVLEAKVPDTEEPRFYYEDVYPEKHASLQSLAWENNCKLNISFGVQDPSAYSGRVPTAEEVEKNLVRIEFYSSIAELLIERGAIVINDISIWPIRHDPGKLRTGDVEYRTTGLNFTMRMEDLVRFFEFLSEEDRFFSVDSYWFHNKQLRNPNAPIQVQMVLSQAVFKPKEAGSGSTGGAGSRGAKLDMKKAFASGGFGGGGGSFTSGFGGGDTSSLQKRKGFFGKLLDLIPFL